ncbi:unnamed protein product [Boreogadus saida]
MLKLFKVVSLLLSQRFQGDDDGRDLNPCLQISVEISMSVVKWSVLKLLRGDLRETFVSTADLGSSPTNNTQIKQIGSCPTNNTQIKQIGSSPTNNTQIKQIGSPRGFKETMMTRDLNPCLQISVEIR